MTIDYCWNDPSLEDKCSAPMRCASLAVFQTCLDLQLTKLVKPAICKFVKSALSPDSHDVDGCPLNVSYEASDKE